MSIAQDVSPYPVAFDIHRHIRVRRGLGREIAQACRITPEAVWLWRRVPTWHLEAVSRLLNIPIGVLRPDLDDFVGHSRPLPQYVLTPIHGTPRRSKSTSSPSGHELACGCRSPTWPLVSHRHSVTGCGFSGGELRRFGSRGQNP
jgi:hypothetical protein